MRSCKACNSSERTDSFSSPVGVSSSAGSSSSDIGFPRHTLSISAPSAEHTGQSSLMASAVHLSVHMHTTSAVGSAVSSAKAVVGAMDSPIAKASIHANTFLINVFSFLINSSSPCIIFLQDHLYCSFLIPLKQYS